MIFLKQRFLLFSFTLLLTSIYFLELKLLESMHFIILLLGSVIGIYPHISSISLTKTLLQVLKARFPNASVSRQDILHYCSSFLPGGTEVKQGIVSCISELSLWGKSPCWGLHVVHVAMCVCIREWEILIFNVYEWMTLCFPQEIPVGSKLRKQCSNTS